MAGSPYQFQSSRSRGSQRVRQPQGQTFSAVPRGPGPSQAAQVANAVDRARATATGGPGRPMTLPHDFSGFERTFTPSSAEALAARHPNIQSTKTPPPTDAGAPAAAPIDVDSANVQHALNRANVNPALPDVMTRTPTGNVLASAYGTGSSSAVAPGTPQPTAAETASATTANGVVHPAVPVDWQQQVMKNHPEIAQEGSDANKAFIAAYNDAKGKGGTFDPIALAKNTMDSVNTNRQLAEGEKQENEEGAAFEKSEADKAKAAQSVVDARTKAANVAADKALSERLLDPNTLGGKAETAIRAVPSIPGKIADAAANAGQYIAENLEGVKTEGPSTGPSQLQSMPGQGKAIAKQIGLGNPNLTSEAVAGRESFANLRAIPKPTGGAEPQIAPAQSSNPATKEADVTPSIPTQQPTATYDSSSPASANVTGADASEPNYAHGLAPSYRFPNYADGGATVGGGDNIDLADNMRRANSVQNVMHHPDQDSQPAPSFNPQPSGQGPTAAQNAEASAWKSDMQAANAAIASDDKAAGIANQGTMDEQLAGPNGPMATVQGNRPNYAKGKPFQFGKPMQRAMNREKTAIAHHVGGARRGDKPEPVNLPGVGPSVVNSGEKVIPNAAGGAAVLTRNMQKKPFQFRPR